MKCTTKISIVFFLTVQFAFTQEFKNKIDSIINLNIAPDYQSLKIQKLLKDKNSLDLQQVTYYTSVSFYRKKILSEAIFYGERNLELISEKKPLDSLLYRKSLYLLGFLYCQNKDTNKGKAKYYEIIQQNNSDRYDGQAHYRLALIHKESGDFHKAFEYAHKAYKSYISSNYKSGILDSAIFIGNICQLIASKESINKGIKILEHLKKSNLVGQNDLLYIYHALGNLYNSEKFEQKEKALENYFEALDISERKKDNYTYITLHNSIENIYLKHDLKKAFTFLNKGIKIAEDQTQKGWFFHNLGIYNFKKGDYEKSFDFLKQSIISYLKIDTQLDLEKISISKFQSSPNKSYILDALIFLIEYQNQIKSLSRNDLKSIHKHIHIAEQLVEHIRFESDDQQSKLYWQEQASKLYQNAVKTAFLAKDPQKAFYFMEKNKAVLLLEDISDNALKKNANLPKKILKRETHLKNLIYSLQDLYLENNIINKDSIADLVGNAKIKYYNFIDSLKVDYPKYYDYKKPTEVRLLNEIQSSLQKKEIIIEYILNEKNGYGLLIGSNTIDFFELDNVTQLNKDISNFKSKITSPFVSQKDFENYSKQGYKLYQNLFPFASNVDLTNKKITIVPDYSLQNFPFEALVTQPNFNSNTHNYLISSTEINYTYSISFLKENKTLSRSHTVDFSGFAPIQFEYDQLSTLKRSRQEIEAAEKQFAGILFINEDATKDSFKTSTEQSKIIHLSTHANATDSISPWIAFKDSKLTLNELYTTKNNAELVVLSTCNSSLGELKLGEGVMSLARGFFYTGANSVIASLWNVDDKSGQYITSSFYKHLKKGKTKSEALRLAKLNYLKKHSLSETSPYYWSSLVLIGDSGAIGVSSLSGYWWALLIGIAVLIALIFWARKKRN